MSIYSEITRIQAARNQISSKLAELGLAEAGSNIDACSAAVEKIQDKGNISARVKGGQSYTIPRGYHRGEGRVTGVAATGLMQSKTAEPSRALQTLTPDSGYDGLSQVTVRPIPELYQDVSPVTAGAADVLLSKVIVDKQGRAISGSMPDNGSASRTIDAMNSLSVSVPAGYTSGGTVSITDSVETALAAI